MSKTPDETARKEPRMDTNERELKKRRGASKKQDRLFESDFDRDVQRLLKEKGQERNSE